MQAVYDAKHRCFRCVCLEGHVFAVDEPTAYNRGEPLSCPECETVAQFGPLGEKHVKSYMRLAKAVADNNTSCHSRHLGAVVVKVYPDGTSRHVNDGYNGPPAKTPHCDSAEYLREIVWPQLSIKEKRTALATMKLLDDTLEHCRTDDEDREAFVKAAEDCKTCPRRLIGAPTGERTDICSCQHAERNVITNATEDLYGCWLFGWHGVPCMGCAGAIINARIKKVFVAEDGSYAHGCGADYSFGARRLLQWAKVDLVVRKPEFYLN